MGERGHGCSQTKPWSCTIKKRKKKYALTSYCRYRAFKMAPVNPHRRQQVPIENCVQWEFKCPMSLDQLQGTEDREKYWCRKCNKAVYMVHDMEELNIRVYLKAFISTIFFLLCI
jgi:hypothetical protein